MPLVSIEAKRECRELTEQFLDQLLEQLQTVVAQELASDDPDGGLMPSDIEISWDYVNPKRRRGGEKYDLKILILANDYPLRKKDLFARAKRVKEALQKILPPHVRGYVWPLLATGAFVEF